MIASGDIEALDNLFRSLPKDSPARMSYNVYATGSDTIKASVLTGLGTRLQAFKIKIYKNLLMQLILTLYFLLKDLAFIM